MRRKKRPSIIDLVPPFFALAFLGFYFVPWLRLALLLIGAVAVFAIVVLIIYRLANRKCSFSPASAQMPVAAVARNVEPISESLSEKFRKLDWFQFEKLVEAIYSADGYSVQRMGGAQPDGGVDIIIEHQGLKSIVQCKHWKSQFVGVAEIREFLGALTDHQSTNGIFIATKGFTQETREFASRHKIMLLEAQDLMALMEKLDWKWNPGIRSVLEDTRKRCPKCNREMILRTARKGANVGNQFWGCSGYPNCKCILKNP